jgi:predicted branched-subunit amino acid permease
VTVNKLARSPEVSAAGLDVWQTCVLSLLMFSGGSQFALVGVVAAAGAAAGGAAIASAVLLGTRNSLYGSKIAPMIGPGPGIANRLLAGHWTIDETTAASVAQPTVKSRRAGACCPTCCGGCWPQ